MPENTRSSELGKEFRKLITQSNKDLLERVRSEVIGTNIPRSVNNVEDVSFTKKETIVARLRAEQRSVLQKIEEEM